MSCRWRKKGIWKGMPRWLMETKRMLLNSYTREGNCVWIPGAEETAALPGTEWTIVSEKYMGEEVVLYWEIEQNIESCILGGRGTIWRSKKKGSRAKDVDMQRMWWCTPLLVTSVTIQQLFNYTELHLLHNFRIKRRLRRHLRHTFFSSYTLLEIWSIFCLRKPNLLICEGSC